MFYENMLLYTCNVSVCMYVLTRPGPSLQTRCYQALKVMQWYVKLLTRLTIPFCIVDLDVHYTVAHTFGLEMKLYECSFKILYANIIIHFLLSGLDWKCEWGQWYVIRTWTCMWLIVYMYTYTCTTSNRVWKFYIGMNTVNNMMNVD